MAYAGWAPVVIGGVVLAEGWQPWARIVGTIVFLGWLALAADFVARRRSRGPR